MKAKQCRTWNYYSNYHAAVDDNGYFAPISDYYEIYNQAHPGLHPVPVVHCSYFIQQEVLPKMKYDDGSYRYEYVVFSDVARKNNIDQCLDNREVYGLITFAETVEQFEKDPAFDEVQAWLSDEAI